jgi:protein-S-isoprenylcysteine O-methyltransferase Ste14
MDPINIIAGLNIIAAFGANLSGAKKGLRSSIIGTKVKPKTYLQSIPLTLSALTLVALVLAVFQIGTFKYGNSFQQLRLIGLTVYILFSWIQIWAYKSMGENYAQEILIFKDHRLIEKGPFGIVRHPQYISQILLDLGAGIATLSYILIPLALIELPLLILRAALEEKLLAKNFKDTFDSYKKKTGFMIPFVG